MRIELQKSKNNGMRVNWNYTIFIDNVHAGMCTVELIDGVKYNVLDAYQDEESHNCYDILHRINEVCPQKLHCKIAFINLLKVYDDFQKNGIGKASLTYILNQIKKSRCQMVILDAFRGGFLIPFYESFGFCKIPCPPTLNSVYLNANNGGNFMWLSLNKQTV